MGERRGPDPEAVQSHGSGQLAMIKRKELFKDIVDVIAKLLYLQNNFRLFTIWFNLHFGSCQNHGRVIPKSWNSARDTFIPSTTSMINVHDSIATSHEGNSTNTLKEGIKYHHIYSKSIENQS